MLSEIGEQKRFVNDAWDELERLASVRTLQLPGQKGSRSDNLAALDRTPIPWLSETLAGKPNLLGNDYVHTILRLGEHSLLAVIGGRDTPTDLRQQRNRGLPSETIIALGAEGHVSLPMLLDATKPPLVIGNGDTANWGRTLDDPGIADRHLAIGWFGDELVVQDLGSEGTFIARSK